jgi:hypothetical protein
MPAAAAPLQLALVKGESYGYCTRQVAEAVPAPDMISGPEELAALVQAIAQEQQAAAYAAAAVTAQPEQEAEQQEPAADQPVEAQPDSGQQAAA